MIGLLGTGSGAVALADIQSIQHVAGDVGRAEYYAVRRRSDAAALRLFAHEYNDLMMRPVQIMPAEPGTRLILVYSLPCDETAMADTDPVLAWALCMDGQVRPVLPSGVRRDFRFNDQNVWHPDYVQLPNGKIYQFGLETDPGVYASIEEVIDTETKRLQRHEAERKRVADEQAQGNEGIAA